jgi:hypothetical protein
LPTKTKGFSYSKHQHNISHRSMIGNNHVTFFGTAFPDLYLFYSKTHTKRMNFAQIRAILKNKDSHVNIDSTKKGNITNMGMAIKI